MSGVNKVIMVGNLGKDPEVRYTSDGKPIANIALATSESWKDKNTGQRQEKTEWHRVVFFGGVAGIVAEYLKKGSKIYIEGKLATRKWQDQSGQDRYTTEIVVDGFSGVMQMLDSRTESVVPEQNGAQNFAPQAKAQVPQHQPSANQAGTTAGQTFEGELDDDIPF